MTIALDIGTRHARMTHVTPDGTPRLLDLPGSASGEGLPLSSAARGSRVTALVEAYDAYRSGHGPAARIVIVLPQRDKADQARELASAFAGRPNPPEVRPLGTPHAVLALLRHRGTAPDGRYVVCDLGARAADVSVCTITGADVAVVGSASRTPGTGLGDAFDAALLAGAGLPVEAGFLTALAEARREDGADRRLRSALDRAVHSPEIYDSTTVYWLGDQEIGAGSVRRSLATLNTELDRALDAVRLGELPSALVPVGGLARLSPLLDHLAARHRVVALPDGTDPGHAAALGAALVAAGLVDPGDHYPHAVCVSTHRVVAGRLRSQELEISPAGALEPGCGPVFAESDGQRLQVATGDGEPRPVVVSVRAAVGSTAVAVRTVRIPPGAPGDRWHVGVRLSVEGTAHLVLQPVRDGTRTELQLGRLPVDLAAVRR